jgi:hypothetical protein
MDHASERCVNSRHGTKTTPCKEHLYDNCRGDPLMSSISESRLVHNKLAKPYYEQACATITIQSILQIYNDELAANS